MFGSGFSAVTLSHLLIMAVHLLAHQVSCSHTDSVQTSKPRIEFFSLRKVLGQTAGSGGVPYRYDLPSFAPAAGPIAEHSRSRLGPTLVFMFV